MMASRTAVLIALAVTLVSQLTVTNAYPVRPTNCTMFDYVEGGVESAGVYASRLYNYQWALETDIPGHTEHSIHTDLFKGLGLLAVAGMYSQLINSLEDNPELQNYEGWNNLRIPQFFGKMLFYIIRDVCLWLLSYDDSLTIRLNINCSHPAEQIMLSQFAMMVPLIHGFEFGFTPQFKCPGMVFENWMDMFMLSQYQPEINWLQAINGHPQSSP